MAELSSRALANFTAATTALILTQSLRLSRNYKYYNNISEDSVERNELLKKVKEIRTLAYTLENLMLKDRAEEAPFFVSISGSIHDIFEEVHRKLLFYEPDLIIDIIPIIDRQRTFWSRSTDTDFYNSHLLKELENPVPEALLKIENKIMGLPAFARV